MNEPDSVKNKKSTTIKKIAEQCFTPLTVGGNINSFEKAIKIIRNGADKILLNSASEDKNLIKKISDYLGSQCVVVGIDIINIKNQYFINKMSKLINLPTIFEGGLGSLTHVIDAIQAGANSLALGSMLVLSDNNIFKIKQEIKNKKFETRLRD